MCVGVPYRIIKAGIGFARATSRNVEATIDTRLVGAVEPGDWVLTFLGAAREKITALDAKHIEDALEAVGRAMAGETDLDHLFADLIGREPRLPEFLRPSENLEKDA